MEIHIPQYMDHNPAQSQVARSPEHVCVDHDPAQDWDRGLEDYIPAAKKSKYPNR